MDKKNQHKISALKYTGLAMQFMAGIGIMLFVGIKSDAYLNTGFPLLTWLLPLLIIAYYLYKIIKETTHRK